MQYLNSNRLPVSLAACATIALLSGLGASPQALAQSATAAAPNTQPTLRGEPVTLNFANAEIEAVARAMASMTGRNVVVDPRVKGTMNLNTERAVSPAVAYNLFLATIRLQGYTVVEVGGLDKVVPEADAKLQGGSVWAGPVSANSASQLTTQIFKLNFEPANNLVAVLRPLISPNNTINVNPGNNSLVITDYADNLQRIARIIAALDVANATDVEILPLKHALAVDLAPLVLRLVESAGSGAPAGQADTSFKTTLVAETRSNTLILRAANAARVAQIKLLVEKLDQPTQGSNGAAGNIYVVYLKNADATKLAVTLRAAMSGEARAASAPSAPASVGSMGGPVAASAQPSTGGQIQADPSTNSLIITAPEPQYRQLRAVIDRLDARRAQVFVESLIIEINDDKAAQFGVQWQDLLGSKGHNKVLVGTNYNTNGSANIVSLAGTLAAAQAAGLANVKSLPTAPAGLNLGYLKNINGLYVLGALANMLQSNGIGNVLSTPNVMTLDNEEAKITVGQNVPMVTGSYASTGGGTNPANPFQTIERKDVGLTLKIKPQISENGTIRMTISQEVSSIQASSVNSATGIITNKRLIETNVLVEDGSIVVLGGLLQDQYSGNQDKVPGLGDVPLFGNLFKSESRSRSKTNLMVFLRPVVMRDANEVEQLSLGRYDQIRAEQAAGQPGSSSLVPVNEAPQLPALAPRPAPAPAPSTP